jgi:predicted membrane metal-binding protein
VPEDPAFRAASVLLSEPDWYRPLHRYAVTSVAIVVVTVPLIYVVSRDVAMLIVLVALCLYPFVDVPRILARPSWWLGAITSALVWFVVFVTFVGIVDSVHQITGEFSNEMGARTTWTARRKQTSRPATTPK